MKSLMPVLFPVKGSVSKKLLLLFAAILLKNALPAAVRLPRLISDGIVLQRNQPIKIWGWAAKGERVNIIFRGRTYTTNANEQLKWELVIPAMPAGGPYDMLIRGENEIVVHNILLGDVWICSGQSNMEFTVGRAREKYASEIATSGNDQIRQFLVKRTWNFVVQDDVQSDGWKAAGPNTVNGFTAVGYFFARDLYEKYKVPIGLINTSVGGTPAEAWTSIDGLRSFPHFLQQIDPYQDSLAVQQVLRQNKTLTSEWYRQLQQDKGISDGAAAWADPLSVANGWRTMQIPGAWANQGIKNVAGITWMRKEIDLPAALAGKEGMLYLGHIAEQDSTYLNGIKIGATNSKHMPRQYRIPAGLLKAGKNLITIRVLNTTGNGEFYMGKRYELTVSGQSIPLQGSWQYATGIAVEPFPTGKLVNFGYYPTVLFNSMIAPLIPFPIKGVIWYQGEANTKRAKEYQALFPAMIKDWRRHWKQQDLPFLFVQLANLGKKPAVPGGSQWAALREAQAGALKLHNTGMAVTYDIGEWNDIHPLNKLDVGRRLARWAEKIVYKEPQIVYSGPLYKSMEKKNNTIVLSFNNTGSGLCAAEGLPLEQFAIAGADRKFVWAQARIEGTKVIVWNDAIAAPVAVRYAWANNPEGANLYNKEGLPASPFRTDDWEETSPAK